MNALANFLLGNDEPGKLDTPGVQLSGVLARAAKGMKGEREKCPAAGVYDHIAKPVNPDLLLLLLRVRLHRQARMEIVF